MPEQKPSVPPGRYTFLTKQQDKLEDKVEKLGDKKADLVYVESELDHLEKDVTETKEIALSAKKRAEQTHKCEYERTIDDLQKEVNGWGAMFRKSVLGFISFLVVVGGGWLWQFFTLTDSVADTQENMVEIKESVKTIKQSHQQLQKTFEKGEETDARNQAAQLHEIKESMKVIMEEAVKDRDTRRGRRTR